MNYKEAVELWGKAKLETAYPNMSIDPATVYVDFDFQQGFACCGGRDPDCYCSLAESPSANVKIAGVDAETYTSRSLTIPVEDFDFVKILGEIVSAGDGTLTSEPSERTGSATSS